jgi:hypothetical protein
VAFWRRTAQGIEFYIPLNLGYLEALSHRANGCPANVARAWVEREFGLNPRSTARVIDAIVPGSVVAFTLSTTELDKVAERMVGAWVSAWDLGYPLSQMLGHVGRHLA